MKWFWGIFAIIAFIMVVVKAFQGEDMGQLLTHGMLAVILMDIAERKQG